MCVCVHILGHGQTHSVGEADGTFLLFLCGDVRRQELKVAKEGGAGEGGDQLKQHVLASVDQDSKDSLVSNLDLHGGVELAHGQQQQCSPAHSSSRSEDGSVAAVCSL